MSIINIEDLTVMISGKKILDNFSLNIKKGLVTSLVGESGSGKTMVSLALLGLLPKTAIIEKGEISFKGKSILNLTKTQLRKIRGNKISMVFQEPFLSLNPVMKIGAQVEEAFIAHRKTSKKERMRKIRDLFSVLRLNEDIIKMYPHEISGGMRQRVLIATAIALDPEVLILDEPTTALDVSVQKDILSEIKRIRQLKKLTILFISHDFSVVNLISDFIAVMKNGQLVEFGEKEKIIREPQEEYTKQLIECIPRLGDKRERLPEFKDKGLKVMNE